jgi:hypothetical protein
MMPATVTVAPFVSRTSYGVPTYGAAVGYRARVSNKSQLVRNANAEEVVARGNVILATVAPITVSDKVTLPDGTTPLILVVNVESDETGPIYTKLFFA